MKCCNHIKPMDELPIRLPSRLRQSLVCCDQTLQALRRKPADAELSFSRHHFPRTEGALVSCRSCLFVKILVNGLMHTRTVATAITQIIFTRITIQYSTNFQHMISIASTVGMAPQCLRTLHIEANESSSALKQIRTIPRYKS